jgi:hypothetical protein
MTPLFSRYFRNSSFLLSGVWYAMFYRLSIVWFVRGLRAASRELCSVAGRTGCRLPYRNVSVQILPRTANGIRLDSPESCFLTATPATSALAGRFQPLFLAANPHAASLRRAGCCSAATEVLRTSHRSKPTLNAKRAGILRMKTWLGSALLLARACEFRAVVASISKSTTAACAAAPLRSQHIAAAGALPDLP